MLPLLFTLLLLLCAGLYPGQAFPRLHVTSDVRDQPQSGASLQVTPLTKDSFIIASLSAPHNGNNPKNAFHKEHPIQASSPSSADRMGQEGRGNRRARLGLTPAHVTDDRDENQQAGTADILTGWKHSENADIYSMTDNSEDKNKQSRTAEIYSLMARKDSAEGNTLHSKTADRKRRVINSMIDRVNIAEGNSLRRRTAADRKRRDIYSLISSELRKRHKLESDEDIRRLLAALNTIRDIVKTDRLPSDLSQLELPDSLDTPEPKSKIDLSKNPHKTLTHTSLSSFFRGPSKQHSFPTASGRKSSAPPQPEYHGQRQEHQRNKVSPTKHPNPPHPSDMRNKHQGSSHPYSRSHKQASPSRYTSADEVSGSVDNAEVNGLALAQRTGPGMETENSLVGKSQFYPEFNPTGW